MRTHLPQVFHAAMARHITRHSRDKVKVKFDIKGISFITSFCASEGLGWTR